MAKIICILVRVNIYSSNDVGTRPAPTKSITDGTARIPVSQRGAAPSGPRSEARATREDGAVKREWGGGWGPGGERDNTVYGEPVNVQARDDGRPARFVWRGRLYTVHAILEHWVINREWWQDPEAEPGQPELEFWRVEASPGQGMTASVYELRRDAATDAWTLRPGA
jgi:hypothetical protein